MTVRSPGDIRSVSSLVFVYPNSNAMISSASYPDNPRTGRLVGVGVTPRNAVKSAKAREGSEDGDEHEAVMRYGSSAERRQLLVARRPHAACQRLVRRRRG